MPKLYRNIRGAYYTRSRNKSGEVITLQIKDSGAQWLLDNGFEVDQELGTVFWDLVENDQLFTRGEVLGGGEFELSTNWIRNQSLAIFAVELDPFPVQPPTIPTRSEFTNAPRFLYAPHRSIYYTILHIGNSSDAPLEVPLLIKPRGAMELLRLGAAVDEEFTEDGLKLLFARRWCYHDEDRFLH